MELVHSMILPIGERQVVVPNAAIAEIISYKNPMLIKQMPAWFLGLISWRGRDVPLLCLDRLNGMLSAQSLADKELAKDKIAVFNMIDGCEHHPFMGVLLQGAPKLSRVMENDIKLLETINNKIFIMKVAIRGQQAYILDVSSMQQYVRDIMESKGLDLCL